MRLEHQDSLRNAKIWLLICCSFWSCSASIAQNTIREKIRQRIQSRPEHGDQTPAQKANAPDQHITLAHLDIAVWKPRNADKPTPLIIFSHGFMGTNTQSNFLMRAICDAGYLVVAPNHKDAMGSAEFSLEPAVSFREPESWSDTTYKDRRDDVVNLIDALRADRKWNATIDWTKVGLVGHSLGGYTVMGLAGAWPSWKIPEAKAVLALSPYSLPYSIHHTLSNVKIPIMYQGGTRDTTITPFVKRPEGAYDQSAFPKYFVEFDQVGHFGWTNLEKNQATQEAIDHYAVAFLNKYVKGDQTIDLDTKLPTVTLLEGGTSMP